MEELVNGRTMVLGVDPGQSGAVFCIGRGVFDGRRDFKTKRDIALAIRDLAPGVDRAVIENVHAMPGQGVCSMFSFGRAAGVADGALYLCLPEGVQVEEVSPQRWQNYFRRRFSVPDEQEFDSRFIASRLYPGLAERWLLRKKDHNTADAILIASWRLLEGNPALN